MNKMIDKEYINKIIKAGENPTHDEIQSILGKASRRIKLNHVEISMLMSAYEDKQVEEIYEIAGKIKREIYGERVVMFAPLYISNFCEVF
jgi:2-iminoacetate synthase